MVKMMNKKVFVSITLLDVYEPEDVELYEDYDDEELLRRVEAEVDHMIDNLGIVPNDIELYIVED